MATPYSDIYDRFMSAITDYDLLGMADVDVENTLLKYLKSSISDFKFCTQDLTNRDDVTGTFNIDLSESEQEILAKFMIIKWLNPIVNNLDNLKQKFGTRDFQLFSSSAHLKELKDLRDLLQKEANSDMEFYYYSN
jgi:hypothetical protein